MSLFPSLRQTLLSTPKQRKRFFWCRNMSTFAIGCLVAQWPTWGPFLCIPAALIGYFTIAPIIAVILCFIEEMLS
jgi:hypothetical protein